MYYTGIDLHKKTSFITTVDERGKIVAKANLPNDEALIVKYFEDLGGETEVAIESTASWYWIYDLLSERGLDVVISNPVKTKAIASSKIKNDKVDSHMLPQLLRFGFIATSLCEQPQDPRAERTVAPSSPFGSGCNSHEESYPSSASKEQLPSTFQ